jgi:hypothetical protein
MLEHEHWKIAMDGSPVQGVPRNVQKRSIASEFNPELDQASGPLS